MIIYTFYLHPDNHQTRSLISEQIRPPALHTRQARKNPPLMDPALRIVLLLDADQPRHILPPDPARPDPRADVVRIIRNRLPEPPLLRPGQLVQHRVRRPHHPVAGRLGPGGREQGLVAGAGVRPGGRVVGLGQVAVQAGVHVLQGPDGGGGDVAAGGDVGDVLAQEGGAVGEVVDGDVLGLWAVEAAAEAVGEEAVDGRGHVLVGQDEGLGGGDVEAVDDGGEGGVGGLLGGAGGVGEAEGDEQGVEGEGAVGEVAGEEAGGEVHEGEGVVVVVEEIHGSLAGTGDVGWTDDVEGHVGVLRFGSGALVEGGDDAELSTTTLQSPEEILVGVGLGGVDDPTVHEDDLHGLEAIRGVSVSSCKESNATT